MIARCLEQQWKGYTALQRRAIDAVWVGRHSTPGSIGSVSEREQLIWSVVHVRNPGLDGYLGEAYPAPSGKLMSVKEARWVEVEMLLKEPDPVLDS